MSFFSRKAKGSHRTKLPPVGAFEHYTKKQNFKSSEKGLDEKGEALIQVDSITLSYEGKAVLDGLSFCVRSGDYISIVGENGSGKTTLMNALLGLMKPNKGSISLSIKRCEIGFLPQFSHTDNDFPATVGEVVLSGVLARSEKSPFLPKGAKKLAFSNMEKLGITSLASRSFSNLSGGQKQRALIARALCAATRILILDEPVTGLDRSATADVYSLIESLNANGMTVISVTHDIKAAIKYSSKILYIDHHSAKMMDVDEFKKLPMAVSATGIEDDSKEDVPYGEGGFRYGGKET